MKNIIELVKSSSVTMSRKGITFTGLIAYVVLAIMCAVFAWKLLSPTEGMESGPHAIVAHQAVPDVLFDPVHVGLSVLGGK